MKPRHAASLLGRISDKSCGKFRFMFDFSAEMHCWTALVFLESELDFQCLREDIELPIREDGYTHNDGEDIYTRFIKWDLGEYGKITPKGDFKPYMPGANLAAQIRKSVTQQEGDAAELIGGHRHLASGSIPSLKSDASSDEWQVEAKQTRHKSIRVTLGWLQKIQDEARDKYPALHLRFTDIPEPMTVHRDWLVIPASVFKEKFTE